MNGEPIGKPNSGVTSVVATFSITLTGEGQEPLMAARILVDGKQVDLPFVLSIGRGERPLMVAKAVVPKDRIDLARVLSRMATDFTAGVLDQIEQMLSQETSGVGNPAPDNSLPSRELPIDNVVNL